MKRCAVVIGVDRVAGLPTLSDAASGAADFAEWAQAQETDAIDVELLTDAGGHPVSFGQVRNAVKAFANRRIYDQMIVYFAGHGILKSQLWELWLLSDSKSDPNEAVSVFESIEQSRNVSIPHVVFISDACRSAPAAYGLSQVKGGILFPSEQPTPRRPEVDTFYATLPGDPALEIRTEEAAGKFRAVFTRRLLKGLSGAEPSVVSPPTGHLMFNHVPSWLLKKYLEDAVPDAASEANPTLQQFPEIRVESHAPKYLSEVRPLTTGSGVFRTQESAPSPARLAEELSAEFLDNNRPIGRVSDPRLRNIEMSMRALVEDLKDKRGRNGFETHTGFTIVGLGQRDDISVVGYTEGFAEKLYQDDAHHVRIDPMRGGKPQSTALLRLPDDTCVPLAVLPGYIGTVVLDNMCVLAINYSPSIGTHGFNNFADSRDVVEERRAFVNVLTRNGLFSLADPESARKTAEYLRFGKAWDPTLGLYAAYAYRAAGRIEEVDSVLDFMARDSAVQGGRLPENSVFFDLKMLSSWGPAQNADYPLRSASFCPVLTQGWAYLRTLSDPNADALYEELAGELVPGLWTTFTPRGGEMAAHLTQAHQD